MGKLKMSKKDAKTKIKNFIEQTNGQFYPDEIAEKLHIEFELVMDICEELEDDGIIDVAQEIKKQTEKAIEDTEKIKIGYNQKNNPNDKSSFRIRRQATKDLLKWTNIITLR